MSVLHGPKVAPPATQNSMVGNLANKAISAVGKAAVGEMEELLGTRFDPAPAYLFYISISGLIVGLFTGCDGLSVTRATEEIHEGGVNDHTHFLPGQVTNGKITLKRGLSISRQLWDWFEEGLYDCKVKRVNMSIIQGAPGMSAAGIAGAGGMGVVKTWNLDAAYPVSWSLSGLDVNNTTQVSIESIEIAFRSLSLSKVAGTPMNPSALLGK